MDGKGSSGVDGKGEAHAREGGSGQAEKMWHSGGLWNELRGDINRAGDFLAVKLHQVVDAVALPEDDAGDEDDDETPQHMNGENQGGSTIVGREGDSRSIHITKNERIEPKVDVGMAHRLNIDAQAFMNDARLRGNELMNDAKARGKSVIDVVGRTAISILGDPHGYDGSEDGDVVTAEEVSGLVARRKEREIASQGDALIAEPAAQQLENSLKQIGANALLAKLEEQSTGSFTKIVALTSSLPPEQKVQAAHIKSKVDSLFDLDSMEEQVNSIPYELSVVVEDIRGIPDHARERTIDEKDNTDAASTLVSLAVEHFTDLVEKTALAGLEAAATVVTSSDWETHVTRTLALRNLAQHTGGSLSSILRTAAIEQIQDSGRQQTVIDDLYAIESASNSRIDQCAGHLLPILRYQALATLLPLS
uniref:Uncharacterized protein n=1 Tax=Compsopogon caeruleus TaxID=31354 RepID=A0A7S1XDH2_9RHOD